MKFKLSIRMWKKGDLSDSGNDMLVGARQASISEPVDLLGFSNTAISKAYREWSETQKISSEYQF